MDFDYVALPVIIVIVGVVLIWLSLRRILFALHQELPYLAEGCRAHCSIGRGDTCGSHGRQQRL